MMADQHNTQRWIKGWKNDANQFGWIAIMLHWLSALLIIGLLASGMWMVTLTYYSQWYNQAPMLHKSFGVLFGLLLAARLLWRWNNPVPKAHGRALEKRVAHISHWFVYLALIGIVVSGYLVVTAKGVGVEIFNGFTLPALPWQFEQQASVIGWWHRWLSYTLCSLLVLHIAAALKHQWVNKDGTLTRMFGRTTAERNRIN